MCEIMNDINNIMLSSTLGAPDPSYISQIR